MRSSAIRQRRVERALGLPVLQAAVWVVHDPRLLAGVLAAGMGVEMGVGAIGGASPAAAGW